MLDAYVYDVVRTPRGRVRRDGGALAGVAPYELAGQLLQALDRRTGLGAGGVHVDEVILGVSTASHEQGANVSRAATIWADWPDDVSGSVVSRLCCSGLDALAAAAAQVSSGTADLVVGGGVESMSRVPMLADKPAIAFDEELGERTGFVTIGVSADATAQVAGLTRPELDAYALRSHQRAAAAWAAGHFDRSLVPVLGADGEVLLAADDGIRAQMTLADFEAMPLLFPDDAAAHGRVERRLPELGEFPALHSAATAPQMVDGASAALIGNIDAARSLGIAPRARILATATAAVRSPLLTATVDAIRRALAMAKLQPEDIDIVEANESFSVSPLLVQRAFGFTDEILNVDGGAVSMGHPLGGSGGILLATALDALERTGGRYGLLTIPAALGLGTAIVIERLEQGDAA
ncbi:acetyl-CoA C-acetyltransferase [Frankineae bacterium MT45]|nr:acetyl-CoA C-acetyltransferase [Frankineae bacterium MT45]